MSSDAASAALVYPSVAVASWRARSDCDTRWIAARVKNREEAGSEANGEVGDGRPRGVRVDAALHSRERVSDTQIPLQNWRPITRVGRVVP
jgi:hypothetical protein